MEQLEAEKLQRARRWALLVPVRAREAFCSRRRPSTPVSGTDVTEVVLRERETELTPPGSLSDQASPDDPQEMSFTKGEILDIADNSGAFPVVAFCAASQPGSNTLLLIKLKVNGGARARPTARSASALPTTFSSSSNGATASVFFFFLFLHSPSCPTTFSFPSLCFLPLQPVSVGSLFNGCSRPPSIYRSTASFYNRSSLPSSSSPALRLPYYYSDSVAVSFLFLSPAFVIEE